MIQFYVGTPLNVFEFNLCYLLFDLDI